MLLTPLVVLPACLGQERLVACNTLENLATLTIIHAYPGPITLIFWLVILTFPTQRIEMQTLPCLFLIFFGRT